jgi:Flp pilus assembly protein TadB
MIRRFATAVAVSFALSSIAAPALAETPYRTAEAQTFSAQELQAYGLDAATTQRAVDLQNQGYEIRMISEEEAAQYQAGITDNQWIWLGILAGVIVIAVVVAD